MRKSYAGLTLVVVVLAVLAGVAWAWTRPAGAYAVLGEDLIAVRADDQVVSAAIQDAHDAIGQWTPNADGSKSDASFRQAGKQWSAGGAGFWQATTEFADAAGLPVRLDQTREAGRPSFVRITTDAPGGRLRVLNALVASLRRAGLKGAWAE